MTAPIVLDDAGEALWRAVADGWQDQARHDRFVGHCFATSCLAAAAARYRAHQQRHPDDETARQMMARIAFLATQTLRPSPPARPPLVRSPSFLIVLALAGLVGTVLGLFYRGAP